MGQTLPIAWPFSQPLLKPTGPLMGRLTPMLNALKPKRGRAFAITKARFMLGARA